MPKKIIAIKSKKTKTIYFKFKIKGQLATTDEEKDFSFIPIYQGTNNINLK